MYLIEAKKMEHLKSDGEEDSRHNNALPSSPNNKVKLELDDPGLTVSELSKLKLEYDKMCNKLPSQGSHDKSCPCGNNLGIQTYFGFVSPHKDFPKRSIGLRNRASGPLNIFYQRTSLLSIPLSQKYHRTTKSIGNVGDLIVNCSRAADSGRWIFDSKEANVKARSLLEQFLLFQLGVIDGNWRHSKSASADTRIVKSSELCSPPPVLMKTTRSQSSEMNIPETELLFCTSINSTCSYLSSSSSGSVSQGLLCCVWNSGIPYFMFSLDNDGGDVYMTHPQKVKSSVDKALDYVYLFRSKNHRSHRKTASHVVGKMKVSNSVVLDSSKSQLMETEFVLCGRREDYLKEMESISSTRTKSKGLSKKVAELFRSSQVFKHKAIHKFGEPNFLLDDFMGEMFAGELRDADELDHVNHTIQELPPNLELAAIVVKDYQWNIKKIAVTGGWGLKFLEKVQAGVADNAEESSFSCTNFERDLRRNCGHPASKVNVLIPSGFHGGPINTASRPSSLTDRWKSGGHCDCGGWDLGCPLTVLDDNSLCSASLAHDETEKECRPACLFAEGSDHGEPTLRMVSRSKGLYVISFRPSLSAIQSFAIAVAIIHSRSHDLYP